METQSTDEPVAQPKKSRFRQLKDTRPWWMVLVLTLTPTLITSYFTYKASAVASQAKAAEAQRAAEDGYEELVKAVEVLQKHDDETIRAVADLNGHIKAIESMMALLRPHTDERTKETHLEIRVPAGVRDKQNWRPSFPAPTKTAVVVDRVELPKSLSEVTAAKK